MKEVLERLVEEINRYSYDMNAQLMRVQEALFEDDLSPKQTVILDFVHTHQPCIISEIVIHVGSSPSAVSQIVTRLERDNYLKRNINPHNRREIVVSLAEKGEVYYERESQINQLIIEKIYSKMSLEDLMQLHTLIKKLHTIVEEELEHGQLESN